MLMETSRRNLLKITGVAAATSLLGFGPPPLVRFAAAEEIASLTTPSSERKGDMLYRKLGSTGESVSLLGLGGYHIGSQADENESIKIIRTAIDRGVTFLDNCWDYHDGGSEIRMGKALRDGGGGGYREKIF